MGSVKWLYFLFILISFSKAYTETEELLEINKNESSEEKFGVMDLGKSSAIFATNIYKVLAQNPGDILISPSSLQTILALIQMGSRGKTMTEIARAISLPTNKNTVQNAFKALIPFLRTIKYSTFNSANKIYVQEGVPISQNFSEIAKESFGAEIEVKNFNASEGSVKDINKWVEDQTNGKIKNLVNQDQINELTRMVLINALYFSGEWESIFEPELTRPKHFYVNSTYAKTIDMMTTELICLFNDDNNLDAKFLELPYSGGEFSMTFVLPNKRDGLSALEDKLDKVLEPRDLERTDVIVSLPKFNIEHSVDLKGVLQTLGIVEVFQDHADLSEMTETGRDLYVSQVVQKSQIEVNEKGSEAASATAALVIDRIFGGNAFYAGHPFLFILRESNTKTVEFIGRFTGL